jgi:hypothetical protein
MMRSISTKVIQTETRQHAALSLEQYHAGYVNWTNWWVLLLAAVYYYLHTSVYYWILHPRKLLQLR